MSTQTKDKPETPEEMMGSKPVKEHEWLKQLIGEWRVETEMTMPDGKKASAKGRETVTDLGGSGLWAYVEGEGTMPDGDTMIYKSGIGFDLTFKEYRGFWLGSVSSHLWKYTGEMSADGKKLTLNCVGPNMMKDGETANYRDVIEIIDKNHRTLTSFGEGEDGKWSQFMQAHLYRV